MPCDEFGRIDGDRILRGRSSHDEEIRNPWNRGERLTERGLSIHPEIRLRQTRPTTGETNPHHLSHESSFWSNCHISSGRQLQRSDFLIDFLTIDIDITSPVEFNIDHRESLCRARSHSIDTRYCPHDSFEWECYEFLDIF